MSDRSSSTLGTRLPVSTNALDISDLLLELTSEDQPTVSRVDLHRAWSEPYPQDDRPRRLRDRAGSWGSNGHRRIHRGLRLLERLDLVRRGHEPHSDTHTVTVTNHGALRTYAELDTPSDDMASPTSPTGRPT